MSKDLRTGQNPVPIAQNVFCDPWVEPEMKAAPKARVVPLEHNLLEADPSLAHIAIEQAGYPNAKALGGGSGVAILHPLKVLLRDELKIKTTFCSVLGEHTRSALALMMWFHSPTFG